MRRRGWIWAGALLATVCLAGCQDEGGNGAAGGAAQGASSSVNTVERAKSNAYVTAANVSAGAFGQALANYRASVVPQLAGDAKLTRYAVVPVYKVTQIRQRLDAALAMEGTVPEIDEAARTYAAAIAALEPLNSSLANYAESNGFLTDGGARAREEDAGFTAALSKVAEAETVFFDRIEARDERLTREAFEAAPEGSVERDRAGIILSARSAMKKVQTVFADPADRATRAAFAKDLDEMAALVESWDRKVREDKPEGCPALQGSFNRLIGNGRKAVESAETGRFDPDGGATPSVIQQEFSILQMNFGGMIGELNHPFSCQTKTTG